MAPWCNSQTLFGTSLLPSSCTRLSFRHYNKGKSYPVKAQLRSHHTCKHWRCHWEGQLEKHRAQTIAFHNGGMNAIFGKGRTGNRDRQDGTGKHLNFLATNVKYMILESLFIHLQLAKRLNSFLYKNLKKKFGWMYVSWAKNTRNAHYGVSSQYETTETVLFPHLSSIHFPCSVEDLCSLSGSLKFYHGKANL